MSVGTFLTRGVLARVVVFCFAAARPSKSSVS
jgi:hypothetical protein